MKIRTLINIAALVGATFLTSSVFAQRGGQAMPEMTPEEAAPRNLDRLEGQWVAIVNEDWLWRMRVAERGDFTSIPYNARAREVGMAWDESMLGSCLQYGAAGLLRQPLRLRMEWESDDVLRLETDYGQQARRFIFGEEAPANTPSSLQGYSVANWDYDPAPAGRGQPPVPFNQRWGSLHVETSHLTAAWLRSNGAPVSDQATLTEYFDLFEDPTGQDWLVATVIVHDPVYLNQDFVTSSHFRRDTTNGWDPRPCGM